jgi:hypothetical protein
MKWQKNSSILPVVVLVLKYGCIFLMLTTFASEVICINCCHALVVSWMAMGCSKVFSAWSLGDTWSSNWDSLLVV